MEFQSSVEEVDAVTRKINIDVEAAEVTREFNEAVKKLAQVASIKGFRPGKAPPALVKKMHAERLKAEVAERILSKALEKVIEREGISTVGVPSVDGLDPEEGQSLKLTATVSLYPQPEPKDYLGVAIEVPIEHVSDESVSATIDRFRESKATLRKLEFRNSAQSGDVVDLSVSAQPEGEEPSAPEPLVAKLGGGELLPELEEGLPGLEIGASRDIAVTFPADHRDPQLRGKNVNLRVTLNGLFDKVLPEADDHFAESLNQGVKTLLELRVKIRDLLEEEAKRVAQQRAQGMVLERLVQGNEFQLPQVLIDEEIRSLIARSGMLQGSNSKLENLSIEPFRVGLGAIAAKRVRGAILIDRIADLEKVEVSQEELDQRLQSIADQTSATAAQVREILSRENRLRSLLVEASRSKTLQMLVDRAAVTYKEMDSKEIEEWESDRRREEEAGSATQPAELL